MSQEQDKMVLAASIKRSKSMNKARVNCFVANGMVPVYYDKRLDGIDNEKADAIFCLAGSKRILGKIRRIKINSAAQKLSDAALQGLIYSKEAEIALGMYIWGGGILSIPVNLYRLLKKEIFWRSLDDTSYLIGGMRFLQMIKETDKKNSEKRISRILYQESEPNLLSYFVEYFLDMLPWLAVCSLLLTRIIR